MSAPNVRGPEHTFGFIPSHSAERLNGPPGVGPYSRRLVLGLGPIGDMACRIAQQKWIDKIIAVDLWTSGWSERAPRASRLSISGITKMIFPRWCAN